MTKAMVLHFRSKERIRDFGEVFTAENYINQMLDNLDQAEFSNETSIFFEPTCGHGNIVEAILKKRLECIYKKALVKKVLNPQLYAIANAVNTLWAIDLDSNNIEICRKRVLNCCIQFLRENTKNFNLNKFLNSNKEFVAHLLCSIKWHISENELLSSLRDDLKTSTEATSTLVGKAWIKKNKHKPLDFDLSWCSYFEVASESKLVPLEFESAKKFLELSPLKRQKIKSFSFAFEMFSDEFTNELMAAG